jgi:hypothetical protein
LKFEVDLVMLPVEGDVMDEQNNDGRQATERVTQQLFEAISAAIADIQASGDTEGMSRVGPVLLTTGVMVLVQSVGAEATVQVINELGARVERGDFTGLGEFFPSPRSE